MTSDIFVLTPWLYSKLHVVGNPYYKKQNCFTLVEDESLCSPSIVIYSDESCQVNQYQLEDCHAKHPSLLDQLVDCSLVSSGV